VPLRWTNPVDGAGALAVVVVVAGTAVVVVLGAVVDVEVDGELAIVVLVVTGDEPARVVVVVVVVVVEVEANRLPFLCSEMATAPVIGINARTAVPARINRIEEARIRSPLGPPTLCLPYRCVLRRSGPVYLRNGSPTTAAGVPNERTAPSRQHIRARSRQLCVCWGPAGTRPQTRGRVPQRG
jgi:hypothetical protein